MKTIYNILKKVLIVSSFFYFMNTFAQAPNLMSYQAVVRNSSNALVTNSNVGMKISVLQESAAGTPVFVETQTTTTNNNGLATLKIGSGTAVTGTFAAINWATGPYFIKTETDPTGGTSYTIAATSQLMSVPYALFAANGGSSTGSGTVNYVSKFTTTSTLGNSQIFDDGNGVGINNATPTSKFYVNGQGSVDIPLGDIAYTGGTNNNTKVGTIANNSVVTTAANVGTYSNAGKAKNNVAFYGTTDQSSDAAASYTGVLLDNYNNHITTSGSVNGIFNDVGNFGTGNASGIRTFIRQGGAAANATGIYNNISALGKAIGIDMITQTSGDKDITGINNITAGGPDGGSSMTTGAINIGDGFGQSAGAANIGYGEDVAPAYGAYNEADGYGTGIVYGSNNIGLSLAEGDAYGANISATGGSGSGSSTTNGKTIGANVITSGNNDIPLTTVGIKIVNNNNDHITNVSSYADPANPAGYFSGANGSGQGIYAESVGKGYNVSGSSVGVGVTGTSRSAVNKYNYGVLGMASGGANSSIGVVAVTDSNSSSAGFDIALFGQDEIAAANSYAGYFLGKVFVNGTLTTTGPKPFTIDNPMDPQNKLLRHFAVEGPEVLNNYSGNITTNASGKAIVKLPNYFESINKDYRYQLTAIGTFAQAIVSKEINNNQFEITTSVPNVKVSWQVMGVRNDAYMQKVNNLQAEEDKPAFMRGKYLTPAAYGQPESMSAFYLPTDKKSQFKNTAVRDAAQQTKQQLEHSKAFRSKVKAAIDAAKKESELKSTSKITK